MNLIRTADDNDRFSRALVPIDSAVFDSEQVWGTGRLERLVSPETLASFQRGWAVYRQALETGDGPALEAIGPKMILALKVMGEQATAAGHKPLDPSTWECGLPDGRVLVVVRTNAEASAVMRAEREKTGRNLGEKQGEKPTVVFSAETTIPPDLAMTIRSQHEGRALVVVTMREVAALLAIAEGKVSGTPWDGTPAHSGLQKDEGFAADLVRQGFPLDAPLVTKNAPKIAELSF